MDNVKRIELNDGYKIPQLGFGVYLISEHDECVKAVSAALKAGYRHIDTAQVYRNERAVGEAIKKSNIPRKEIFITSKIWISNYGYEKTKKAIDTSLERLDVDYIDLMLLHQRLDDYVGAWKALEEAKEEGKIRSIGVSNFTQKEMDILLKSAKIKPVVDQIECHPYYQRNDMRKYLSDLDIKMEVWYPLGHGDKKLLQEPLFSELAKKYNKSIVQIIMRWHIQKENIVFPKSLNPKHIEDNINIYDFELSESDMDRINAMDKNKSYVYVPSFMEKIFYTLVEKFLPGKKD